MFGNLLVEMKRAKVTQSDIARHLSLSKVSVIQKIYGRTDFTASEMFAIKEHFFPELTLEYLFEKK